MTYEEMKGKIFSAIEKHHDELVELNNHIFEHPEVSGEEYETSKKIVETLRGYGYETEYPFAGLDTAFRAVYGENQHKYKIALLTEYDALPEIGHACGHCLSGCMSILAGLATRELQDELNADVHILGTPNEEVDGAKCTMTAAGIFEEYDMAIMVHLYNSSLIEPKLQCLASDLYCFHGKAAHASAAPWEGHNAFNAAQLMFHAIDMQRQHTKPDAQFHGIIRNGGEAPNIVPEEVTAEVYIRCLDRDYLNVLIDRVADCAEGAAIATQTTWDKTPTAQTYINMKPNPTGAAALYEISDELGIDINGDRDKLFGSSDIGNVSYACPAFHPCLQVSDFDTPIHTREFASLMKTERAYKALDDGAKILALQVAKIFGDEAKVKAMKEDFSK